MGIIKIFNEVLRKIVMNFYMQANFITFVNTFLNQNHWNFFD